MAGGNIKPFSDRRWYEPFGISVELLCNICENYDRNPTGKITCKAYPDGIPSDLLDLVEDDEKPVCYTPKQP